MIADILTLREERDLFEKELIEKYQGTLLTLRANFPGEDKRNESAVEAVRIIHKAVRKHLIPKYVESTYTKEGYIIYLILDTSPDVLKRFAIDLEEDHPLGRLVDMDVRDKEKIYSRSELKLPLRKCYLCSEPAVHCVRSMKHPEEEVTMHFTDKVEAYRSSAS